MSLTEAERRWIRDAKQIMERMPETLFLFGEGESGLVVFHVVPHTFLPMRGDSVDSGQVLAVLTDRCDGGAW